MHIAPALPPINLLQVTQLLVHKFLYIFLFNLYFTSITLPTRKLESNSSLFQRKTWLVFTTHTPVLPFCSRIPPAYKVMTMTTAPAANVSAAVAASAAYLSSADANMY